MQTVPFCFDCTGLVQSKLDYGSIVYGSARKSYVKLLDPVHHQGLRLSLSVFRTSPIQSLYVEAREPSLENRRLKLSLQYTVKLKTNPLNPAHACVFHPEYQPLYNSKPTSTRPLGLRVSPHLQGLGVELDNVAFNYVSDTPPWELERPNIILELAAARKSDTPPIPYHDQYLTIRNDVRQGFYQVPTLQDLFKTVKPEVILDFLKAAALYRLL